MIEDSVIRVLGDLNEDKIEGRGKGRIIKLVLDVFGQREQLAISVKDERIRLADIVPLARALSAKIADIVCERERLKGATIPCEKGCSTCCNYLVPLAVPEVFRLCEEIHAMPLVRQVLIEQKCVKAAQQMLGERPPASFADLASADTAESTAELLCMTSNWYADFELNCPFLCKRMCTIYENRPMACREYAVTGCPEACSGGPGQAKGVYMPARMSEVLGRLARDLEGTNVEGLIMPLALIWGDDNAQRDSRTWPASEMVARFMEIVCEELPGSRLQTLIRIEAQ
jgi:Fe-S-cluster containining protein